MRNLLMTIGIGNNTIKTSVKTFRDDIEKRIAVRSKQMEIMEVSYIPVMGEQVRIVTTKLVIIKEATNAIHPKITQRYHLKAPLGCNRTTNVSIDSLESPRQIA